MHDIATGNIIDLYKTINFTVYTLSLFIHADCDYVRHWLYVLLLKFWSICLCSYYNSDSLIRTFRLGYQEIVLAALEIVEMDIDVLFYARAARPGPARFSWWPACCASRREQMTRQHVSEKRKHETETGFLIWFEGETESDPTQTTSR